MPDPNFEKQVQQKMDELRLSPSPAVWTGVDAEINKKRKRRPLLWLFLLPGLLLAGLAIDRFYNTNSLKTLSPVAQNGQASPNQQHAAAKQIADSIKINSRLSHPTQTNSGQGTTLTDHKQFADKITDQPADQNISKTKVVIGTGAHTLAQNKTARLEQEMGAKKIANGKEDNALARPQTINQHLPAREFANDRVNNESNLVSSGRQIATDSTVAHIVIAGKKNPVEPDPAISKTAAKKFSSKPGKRTTITFGFTAGGGLSAVQSNLFHSTSVAYNAFSAPTAVYQGTTPPPSHVASAIHPHDAFYAGVFAKKTLSKRISITAGLTYHYFSTKIRTGNAVDSLLYIPIQNANAALTNGYYRSGVTNTYINRYHFLELPVAVDLQLNKGKRMPLFWEIGFSLEHLLSASALQFEPVSGLYYKSDDVFNKTQLHMSTSLLAGFAVHRAQIQLGPQFQYGLSDMLNKNARGKQHLFYPGIKVTIAPGKK